MGEPGARELVRNYCDPKDYPKQTDEEEAETVRAVRGGDDDALWKLCCHNMKLAAGLAVRTARASKLDMEDTMSEAVFHLVAAARDFDGGYRFAVYAKTCVARGLVKYSACNAAAIRCPARSHQDIAVVLKAYGDAMRVSPFPDAALVAEYVPSDYVARWGANSKFPLSHVALVEGVLARESRRKLSLNTDHQEPVNQDIETFWCATFGFYHDPDQEDSIDDRVIKMSVDDALKSLSDRRWEAALRLYYGIDGGEKMSLDAVGKRMGVSHEAVRLWFKKAMLEMRDLLPPEMAEV